MRHFTLTILWVLVTGASACHNFCQCPTEDTVTCSGIPDYETLVEIIKNLTSATVAFTVRSSSISVLRNDTFNGTNATNLQRLVIDNCALQSIEENALRSLGKLQFLGISRNPLRSIPEDLVMDIPAITNLSISYCQLAELKPLSGGENIITLDLSSNEIAIIQDGTFTSFPKLQSLSLDNNTFDLNPNTFQGLGSSLQVLTLSRESPANNISDQPFEQLQSLRTLKVAGLVHGSFPTKFFNGLTSLETLDISNNGLPELPHDKMGFFADNLTELTAGKNMITVLTSFKFYPKLKTLIMPNSRIKEIKDGSFDSNVGLTLIDLHGNDMKTIPSELFKNLNKLKELILAGMDCRFASNRTFRGCENLETLILDDNTVIIEGLFDDLGNLKSLSLQNDSLDAIPLTAFVNMKQLITLNLDNNLLRTIQLDTVRSLVDRNTTITLSNNPWDCECDAISDLKTWMDQSNHTVSMTCATPKAVQGEDVSKISKDKLCYAPNISDCCHSDVKAILGRNARVFCNVTGSPQPNITYHVISGEPLPDNRTKYSPDNSSLTVYEVSNRNYGNFTCVAVNAYGNKTKYYDMYILTPDPTLEPSKPYKKGSLTWIILGVAIAVIFIVTVIGLVVYFMRKNRQPNELLLNNAEHAIQ